MSLWQRCGLLELGEVPALVPPSTCGGCGCLWSPTLNPPKQAGAMAARLRGRPAPRQASALARATSLCLSQGGPRGLSTAGWGRDGRVSCVGPGAWVSVVPALGHGLGGSAVRPVSGALVGTGRWEWPGLLLSLSPAVPGLPCVLCMLVLLGCGSMVAGLMLVGLGSGLVEAGPIEGPPRKEGIASPRALGPSCCLRLEQRDTVSTP